MSIRSIIETKLSSITPFVNTIFENLPSSAYVPTQGIPYQTCQILYAEPDDLCITNDLIKDSGLAQITLYYPIDQGAKNIEARAKLIRSTFPRALKLTDVTDEVRISKTPDMKNMGQSADRFIYVVSIYWHSYS